FVSRINFFLFCFSSRRRHTSFSRDWSSDVCSSDLFEFCGAYLAGGQVTETIKNGIVDASVIPADLFVLGMMSALLAAGTWLMIASIRGWPVSTTHSIVGAIIGFASVGISVEAVNWGGLVPI